MIIRALLLFLGLGILTAGCEPARESANEQDTPRPDPAAGSSPQSAVAAAAADAIFVNGKILTVDGSFTIVEAVAVSGDRILATGSNTDIAALADGQTTRTDLGGRTVVPGLIDNHMHFMRATRDWYRHVRWDAVTSRSEALALLAARSAGLPPGEWVLVIGGWTFEQFLDDSNLFTVAELDRALPDRAVYIQEGYRRGFANSVALEAAGIDPQMIDLAGRGVMGLVEQAIPDVDAATWDTSFKQTVADLHAVGLTTVYDVGGNGVTPAYYEAAGRMAAAGDLSMRIFYSLNQGMGIGPTAPEIVAALEANDPDMTGLQFARFGWGESTYGPMRATPWQISNEDLTHYETIASAALARGWQLHEHSMRDEKIDAMLSVFESVDAQRSIDDARWTIAHTNGISKRSIDRANALGMVFAVHSSNRLAAADSGAPPPIALIHESGGIWGMGSDATTVASPNPFHNIGWAVTGRAPSGAINLTQTVSREAALAAHTRSNGYILFREAHIGSLEPGKLADFAVLDRDYLSVPATEIKDLRSVMTVVGGRIVHASAELARAEDRRR